MYFTLCLISCLLASSSSHFLSTVSGTDPQRILSLRSSYIKPSTYNDLSTAVSDLVPVQDTIVTLVTIKCARLRDDVGVTKTVDQKKETSNKKVHRQMFLRNCDGTSSTDN